jgi:hypothetical protein
MYDGKGGGMNEGDCGLRSIYKSSRKKEGGGGVDGFLKVAISIDFQREMDSPSLTAEAS